MASFKELRDEIAGLREKLARAEAEKAAAAEFKATQPEALGLALACQDALRDLGLAVAEQSALKARKERLRLASRLAQLIALLGEGEVGAEEGEGRPGFVLVEVPTSDDPAKFGGWIDAMDNARQRKGKGRGR